MGTTMEFNGEGTRSGLGIQPKDGDKSRDDQNSGSDALDKAKPGLGINPKRDQAKPGLGINPK
jgi:hypothetical protein|tara:strand:+ start:19931 stop:20119 length:189 start_codon:yes stop_codon:yes gene_type:complete